MANGNRGVGAGGLLHQDETKRFADNVAAAQDHDVLACEVNAVTQ